MANLFKITDENWSEVLADHPLMVIDFSATWCGPCKKLTPIYEEIAHEMAAKAFFASCDIDDAQDLAMQYGIMSVPTIAIFKNGKPVEMIVGLQPKERLIEKISQHV